MAIFNYTTFSNMYAASPHYNAEHSGAMEVYLAAVLALTCLQYLFICFHLFHLAIRIALHAILRVIVLALLTSLVIKISFDSTSSFSAEQDNTTRAIHIPIPDNKTSTDMKRRNRILANMAGHSFSEIYDDIRAHGVEASRLGQPLRDLPQSVAAHFPLMIAFQGHPDKGTERVDMGLFLIKAYIGGGDSRRSIALFTSEWYEVGLIWKHWAIYFIPTIPTTIHIQNRSLYGTSHTASFGSPLPEKMIFVNQRRVSEWHSFRIRSCGRINVSKRMSNRTSQIVIVQYEWCLDARKNGRGR
ncbi:hypothetical protein ACJX0J_000950 (mitochondrion) [Zea mays]